MRLDSQHPGYLTERDRDLGVDAVPSYLTPDLPEVLPDVVILVDGDVIENPRARAAGMAPFFGLDGVEPPPTLTYDPDLDGLAAPTARFAPAGPDVDGFNARGAAFSRLLITEPIAGDQDHVAPHRRNPVPATSSFHPDDLFERRNPVALRTGTLPQLGEDGIAFAPPGFDVRQPIIGADSVDSAASIRRPLPSPDFANPADGIEPVRRDRLRFAAA
jgi:hypothetical protein